MDCRNTLIDRYGKLPGMVTEGEVFCALTVKNELFRTLHSDSFFNDQKDIMCHTIIDRFGLGGIMARRDKTGGTVDTIHNARNGIYATDKEKNCYDQRGEYKSDIYHQHKKYIEKNRQGKEQKNAGELTDGYTGENAEYNQEMDLDHIKSAKSIHDDPGRILAEEDGADLANQDSNLTHTDRSINRSKKQKSAAEQADYLDNTRLERQSRIAELRRKKNLSDKERKELNKLQKLEAVDTDEMRRKGAQAEREYEKQVNKYYFSKKFIKNLGITSIYQGAQMGARQLVGVFLTEAISATFDEIRDSCRTINKVTNSWSNALKERLSRILRRITSKWNEALNAGLTGSISGFFSNILTTIINIFITTAKNIVRLIREAFLSISHAIKMILNPPAGMSKAEIYNEAGKIIISGAIISFGILAEETIDKFPPMLAIRNIPAVGEIIADIFYGLLVALVTALALWGWDKLDLFDCKEESRHTFVMQKIDDDRRSDDKNYNYWLQKVKSENPRRYSFLNTELRKPI
jgi:hypothetical protein